MERAGVRLTIRCLVYNHESYLRECFEGFIAQQTTFRFKVAVHDDASTDGSQEIIREYVARYPTLFSAVLQEENQFSQKRFDAVTSALDVITEGEYIAYCEGDDYWIDPYKLQKQVDYMDAHPECGLVYTDVRIYNQRLGKFRVRHTVQTNREDQLVINRIPTLTTCFRRVLFDDYNRRICPQLAGSVIGDKPMWLYMVNECEVKHIPEVTAVYRELEGSISHGTSAAGRIAWRVESNAITRFFYERYEYNNPALLARSIGFGNADLVWVLVQLNSLEGFRQVRSAIHTIRDYSWLLYLGFLPLTVSFRLYSPLLRLVHRLRYRR